MYNQLKDTLLQQKGKTPFGVIAIPSNSNERSKKNGYLLFQMWKAKS